MRLLGIDPGLSTGWALFAYTEKLPATLVDSGQVKGGVEGFIDWWPTLVNDYRVDELVAERFIIDGTVTGSWAPQIEGALKVLAAGKPITWQTRGDKAALLPTEPARRQWFRNAGIRFDSDHSLDAATHCMVLLKRRRHLPTLSAYWPKRSAT